MIDTYEDIFEKIHATEVDGPHVAFALRGPQGKRVWVFGENHEKKYAPKTCTSGSISVTDLIETKHGPDTLVLYEGSGPGEPLFQTSTTIQQQDAQNINPDYFAKYENMPSFKYNEDGTFKYSYINEPDFEDTRYWKKMELTFPTATVLGMKFDLIGRSINYENKVRIFLTSGLKANSGILQDHGKLNKLFKIASWTLFKQMNKLPFPSQEFLSITSDDLKTLNRLPSDDIKNFYFDLVIYVNFKLNYPSGRTTTRSVVTYPDTLIELLKECLSSILYDLERIVPRVVEHVSVAYKEAYLQSFRTLFSLVTTDIDVLFNTMDASEDNVIVYGGVSHAINHLHLFLASGYRLEHIFNEHHKSHISGASKIHHFFIDIGPDFDWVKSIFDLEEFIINRQPYHQQSTILNQRFFTPLSRTPSTQQRQATQSQTNRIVPRAT